MASTLAQSDQPVSIDREGSHSSWRLVAVVSVCTFAAFVLIQVVIAERVATLMTKDFLSLLHQLGRRAYRDNQSAAQLLRPSSIPLWLRGPVLPLILWGVGEFAAIGVSALAVAAGRDWRRWLFAVPALAWAVLPGIFQYSDLTVPGAGLYQGGETRGLFGVGMTWGWLSSGRGALLVDLGVAISLILALAPAAAFIVARAKGGQRGGRERADIVVHAPDHEAAALIVLMFCFGLWIYAQAFTAENAYQWTAVIPVFVPLLVLGLLIDVRRPWLVVAAVLGMGVLGLDWLGRIEVGLSGWPPSGVVPGTFLMFGVPLALGLAWRPLARTLGWLAERPVVSLAILNALNVADALLTQFAVNSEQAVEANPIMRTVGLPAKIVAVLVVGWLLYKVKPRAVVWPVLAFFGVLGWHIVGYVISSRLL